MASQSAEDKLRGGYYTPKKLAERICSWAIQRPSDRVLEPSCGDGQFIEAAILRQKKLIKEGQPLGSLVGIELNENEAALSTEKTKLCGNADVFQQDFFEWAEGYSGEAFDCVVGNPPFIRYQNFPEPSRTRAMAAMERLGLKPSRLTNIWVPFVVVSVGLLKPGGRLAMVIPAELLQVTYAAQLRSFLADHFRRIDIISCNEMFFEGAEQEVVLVLAEDRAKVRHDASKCLIDLQQRPTLESILSSKILISPQSRHKKLQHETEKWLKYFLEPSEIELMRVLRASPLVANLGAAASIDIGVVTGKNAFFVVPRSKVAEFGLNKFVVPLVGRSSHLRGAIIGLAEWKNLAESEERVFLFRVDQDFKGRIPASVKKYIEFGEEMGYSEGFKCSIRDPWYYVPSIKVPNGFLFRQIYDFPRPVLNKCGATSTDTIHRMRCATNAETLIENMYTHLLAASAEIEGRSYGGGVLELEPTEAERLLIPKEMAEALPLKEVDSLIRGGKLEAVLEKNDQLVLQEKLGISKRDCQKLKVIWQKMRDRRRTRKKIKA